jgi:hypothetical protein
VNQRAAIQTEGCMINFNGGLECSGSIHE